MALIGVNDIIRENAKQVIERINEKNIETIMLTGDNKDTAISIAREVGIYKDGDIVLTSEELNKLSDNEVKSKLLNLSINSVLTYF